MSTLTLENVSYTYKNTHSPALKNASCEFGPGILYAVIGPSGSGKSTLLSLLAGLDLPTDGDVRFDGDSLRTLDLDRYRREGVSVIFQAFHLFPLLTALENVCYPMELRGTSPMEARPHAERLLGKVGINAQQMKRYPSHLSGGEQQRVAIARSLASGAAVLLADEPTGNLDGVNTQNVMEILARLARDENYCVIVVTHDSEVADRADSVFRMKDGILIKDR